MTLVYLENVKRGFEQERVKILATEIMQRHDIPDTLPLELSGMWTARCVEVTSAAALGLQRVLFDEMTQQGLRVTPLRQLHVDLRGQSREVIDDAVSTVDNWLY